MDLIWLFNAIQSWNWEKLSYIAVVVSVFVSTILIIRQLSEARRATQAQAFSTVFNILQEQKVRQARKTVFSLKEKPLLKWTKKEIKAADIVCSTYDVVGIMIRNHLLPKEFIVDSWGPSLIRSWEILNFLIDEYRKESGSEYWNDYEWLVVEALKFHEHNKGLIK